MQIPIMCDQVNESFHAFLRIHCGIDIYLEDMHLLTWVACFIMIELFFLYFLGRLCTFWPWGLCCCKKYLIFGNPFVCFKWHGFIFYGLLSCQLTYCIFAWVYYYTRFSTNHPKCSSSFIQWLKYGYARNLVNFFFQLLTVPCLHLLVHVLWNVNILEICFHVKCCYFDIVLFNREEQSEIDVTSGFYVLFGSGINLVKQLFLHLYVYLSYSLSTPCSSVSACKYHIYREMDSALIFLHVFWLGLILSFILSIYVLQSSREKLARYFLYVLFDVPFSF